MIRRLNYILCLCCLLATNSGFLATISYDMKVSKGIVLNSTSTRRLKKKETWHNIFVSLFMTWLRSLAGVLSLC